jgi:hypothetical protein
MTDEGLQPHEPPKAEQEQLSGAPESASFDAYRSTVRLLVGLALIGGDDLIARLRAWEMAHPPGPVGPAGEPAPESAGEQARQALIGLLFETTETARRVVYGLAGLPSAFAGALGSLLQPVADSFLFRPVTASIQAIMPRRPERLERYIRSGRAEEQRSRALAGEVTGLLLEDVVDYASTNPGVLALVDAQVDRLLPALGNDPSLDALVRLVGDRYIAYLNEHPGDVQNLVQGQAVGMATEVRDSVRSVTVTGDTALEMLARAILRRKPREDLPSPNIPLRNGSAPEASGQPQPGGGQ